MLLAVAGVVAASTGSVSRAKRVLLSRFQSEQEHLAHETAEALSERLDAIDRDVRVMLDIEARTRKQLDLGVVAQDREIRSAFDALATVVPHYRTIGLFRGHAAPAVLAIDPTEEQHVARELTEASRKLAESLTITRTLVARGPLSVGGRTFLLYAASADGVEILVVSVDGAALLSDVFRLGGVAARFILQDPTGQVWSRCESRATCQVRDPRSSSSPGPASLADVDLHASRVQWTSRGISTPGGKWTLSVVSSTDALEAQQARVMRLLLLTSGGVIAAVVGVGIFLLRQQRTAATLATRLQSAQELADLRERSEKILENIPVGIAGATRDVRPIFLNHFLRTKLRMPTGVAPTGDAVDGSARTTTGAPPIGITGPAGALPREFSHWLEGLRGAAERALATKQIVTVSPPAGSDGTTDALRDSEVRVVPLGHRLDEVEVLVLIVDLSDVRSLQRQLVRAEKLVTVGALSAGLAHEIGTPLMVIRGWAEHLAEGDPEPALADGLSIITGEIDRIAATIRRVLDFADARSVQPSEIDAQLVADRALDLLRWKLQKRGLSVKLTRALRPAIVAADPSQLEQVFVNLILNACDALPSDGCIEVSLSVWPDRPNFLRIEVKDAGSGIKAEHLNAVFDPYFTTKKRGEGTGLGLTVVSQIVRNHQGDISLQSVEGVGTTVVVNWPLGA